MLILGIIPARGGSKGVPRKNIRLVAGKPLIEYTIEAAKGSRLLTYYTVSTDDTEIAGVAEQLGAPVLMRPPQLATDDTPMIHVMQHVLVTLKQTTGDYDYTVLLQPTAPLRTAKHIDESLRLLIQKNADSVVSVTQVPGHYNPHWQFIIENKTLKLFTKQPLHEIIKRRQELPITYVRNGAIYACKTELIKEKGDIYGNYCIGYIMREEESVNIDSEGDFWVAKRLLST